MATKYPDSIGAWVAEMAYGTADPIREAVSREVRFDTLGYNDPGSVGRARESLTSWLGNSYGWRVDPAAIGFVSDVVSGFQAVVRHFLPPGAPVVVPTPAYAPFLTVPEQFGHPVLRVPGIDGPSGHRMDLAGIDRALAAGGRLVVLCHPHNPTGRAFTREELSALAGIVDSHQARVFSDEIHAPLNLAGRPHVPYASLDERTAGHTITATSASKAWNISGLKCAQLVFSAEQDAQLWSGVADFYIRSVSRLGVAALCAAYEEQGSLDWLVATLGRLRENSRTVAEAVAADMPGVRCTPPESTYLAWLDCRSLGVTDVAAYFREHAGVALCDGEEFGSPGFARLNFALPPDQLERALAAMAGAVADRRRLPPPAHVESAERTGVGQQ
ncbi:aminotransferase class I/II-fold pyridoxal phosphate-dependent enzyme [Kitasatospora sp. NBC_00070]|uniref:MalY/PatB family protein n=1 Tax=Kitasatospora sp. NBC_00070 TaxID=2975962 RepID=UPI003254677E